VPLNLVGNDKGCLNSAPNQDRFAAEPSRMIRLFELLSDLIMVIFYPLSRRDMKVNEGKNWMKYKMKKMLKINLLLDAQCRPFRRATCMYLIAKSKRVFDEVASRFFEVLELTK